MRQISIFSKIGDTAVRFLPLIAALVATVMIWSGVQNDISNLKVFAAETAVKEDTSTQVLIDIRERLVKIETKGDDTAETLKEIKDELKLLNK